MKWIKKIAVGVLVYKETIVYAAPDKIHLLTQVLENLDAFQDKIKRYEKGHGSNMVAYFIDKEQAIFEYGYKYYLIDFKTGRGKPLIDRFVTPYKTFNTYEPSNLTIYYVIWLFGVLQSVSFTASSFSNGVKFLDRLLINADKVLSTLRLPGYHWSAFIGVVSSKDNTMGYLGINTSRFPLGLLLEGKYCKTDDIMIYLSNSGASHVEIKYLKCGSTKHINFSITFDEFLKALQR